MTTKWKYATIPAAQRLSMLREGNKELYDEEVARTKDVIAARLEAGLDVDEQMKWGDTISYNYNLAAAQQAGENPDSVAKTGYSQRLFGTLAVSDGTGNTSEVNNPSKLSTGSYQENYKNENTGTIARAVTDSYVAGINQRLNSLANQYNQYVSDVTKNYERQKQDVLKAYKDREKLLEEKELNEGRAGGGRSATEKLRSRQELIDLLADLDQQKEKAISDAHSAVEEQIYNVGNTAMAGLSDEFYRYNQLLQNQEEAEYQKKRDGAADDQWWREYLLSVQQNDENRAYREAQLALQRQKNEDDVSLSREQLEYKRQESDRDYDKWLKEFEEETAQARSELARKYASDRMDADTDAAKLQLERDKLERQLANDAAKQTAADEEESRFSNDFWEYMREAKRMMTLPEYDARTKRYVKKYTEDQMRQWVGNLNLSKEERTAMLKALNLM